MRHFVAKENIRMYCSKFWILFVIFTLLKNLRKRDGEKHCFCFDKKLYEVFKIRKNSTVLQCFANLTISFEKKNAKQSLNWKFIKIRYLHFRIDYIFLRNTSPIGVSDSYFSSSFIFVAFIQQRVCGVFVESGRRHSRQLTTSEGE